ncbi:MAG: phospho-N-acetylmuramoyl-pentapeptide-transferase [Clostridia bacterium]|nr:phospho-N-acetylmuramoyl-pentapeptide-transferase [Clostridia bacterium]
MFFSCLIAPTVLWFCTKLKAQQNILHYVDKHASKQGTPTMGGVIFLSALCFVNCFLFPEAKSVAVLITAVTLLYGLIGFLDDYIKVCRHQKEGLKPYQKLVGQLFIAMFVAIFLFKTHRTSLFFFGQTLEIGWAVIPFTIFVLLATTNSVNLTDGLDGLAGGVSFVYIVVFGTILALSGIEANNNIALLCFGLCGGLLGFLLLNSYPAKIFMGDTGSIALGGFIGTVGLMTGYALLIPIMGIMFVLTALSDIIQVAYYKRTRKRIFLMAPLHHHLELKGLNENKIVTIYIIITTAVSLLTLAGVIAL